MIGTDGGAGVELAGGGSGTVTSSNTIWPITGIQNAAGPNVKVTYTAGDDNGTTDIPQAVAAAKAATDAIIYVNAPEGEETDLTTLDLSATDESMISQVAGRKTACAACPAGRDEMGLLRRSPCRTMP